MAGQRRELLTVSQLVHGGGGGELEKHVIRHAVSDLLCQIHQSICLRHGKSAANLPPAYLAAHSRIPTKYYD